MAERCENCRFWNLSNDGMHEGECRRNAPLPTDHVSRVIAEYLPHIAWAINQLAGIEQPKDCEFEPTEIVPRSFFPLTERVDWCGEYQSDPLSKHQEP